MIPLIGLASTLIGAVSKVMQGKQEIRSAKVEATIQSIKRGEVSSIGLDSEAIKRAGLMDDISFFVFLSPALLAFYPPALPHIMNGFQALETMPQWWQAALGMMLVSVWGYRKLLSPIIQSIAKAYLKR